MFGNYIVNDDWIFIRQIEAFSHGIFKLSAEIDPSFIFQGYLGYFWSKLFGNSIISLQILTFLITIIGLIGFVKILKHLNASQKIQILFSLIYMFNPLIFTAAFSFMTDNFFLTFLVWDIYFFLKYYDNKNTRTLIIAGLFLVLSTLIRQIGILTGISFIVLCFISLMQKYKINKKISIRDAIPIFPIAASIIFSIVIIHVYPRFGINRTLIRLEQLPGRFYFFILSLPYALFFLFPSLPTLTTRINTNIKRYYLIFISILIISFMYLYNFDFFPIGNVFYLEGLYTKSNFKSNFSILDNIFFKVFFAILLSYVYATFLTKIIQNSKFKKLKVLLTTLPRNETLFLYLNAFLYYIILLISSDFYDRYLIPSFIFIFIIFIEKFKDKIKVSKMNVFCLILLIFMSFSLELEFSTVTKLKYVQAQMLQKDTGYISQINLNNTYLNYAISKNKNDYTGLIERKSFEYKCYIQQYTLDGNSILLKQIQNLEEYIDTHIISKPKPYNTYKKQLPKIKNHLNELAYNKEYFSVIYNLVGKNAYVGSWCDDQ